MEKLTILFFSRNDVDNAIDLVNDIKDVADEIILIDQSDREEKRKLMAFKRKAKLKKFKVYDCIALGYPEPLQAYAFTKCTNEWVLRLDTDERIPDAMKKDLKKIISTTKSDGFTIRRYEAATPKERGNTFTWQTRLFKKSKTTYTGILHEQPQVSGSMSAMEEDRYYIKHMTNLMSSHTGDSVESSMYGPIHKIDKRLSYGLYNIKMIDYIAKFMLTDIETARKRPLGRLVSGWMRFYERLFFRNTNSEISSLDYFMYFASTNFGYWLLNKKARGIFKIFGNARDMTRRIEAWQRAPDGKTFFEVSKIINTVGIIKFLNLDNPAIVERLTQKYGGEEQGVHLLILLLKERYEKDIAKRAAPTTMI